MPEKDIKTPERTRDDKRTVSSAPPVPAPSATLPVEADPLQQYMAEINKYPLLTPEEEEKITREFYETGDPELASRIVTSNLRLVVKIAQDFQKFWMQNFLDLLQEGNVGLMQAVKKFDPYKGVKFSYYASFWIKAYILKFIMDNWRLVKIGTTQAQRKLFYNLNKEKARIRALGFEPTPELISENLDVSAREVVDMEQRMGSWEVSLDAPVRDDSEDSHMDFLPSDQGNVEAGVARREIAESINNKFAEFHNTLEGRDKIIFEQRLITDEPRTLQELGKEFNVSRERVRQIEERLKQKLKKFLENSVNDIDSYAEGIGEE
jgi:RNA polymerase sigma-32 factor